MSILTNAIAQCLIRGVHIHIRPINHTRLLIELYDVDKHKAVAKRICMQTLKADKGHIATLLENMLKELTE